MSGLCEDEIWNILLYVPVNSLGKFARLGEDWNKVFKNDNFWKDVHSRNFSKCLIKKSKKETWLQYTKVSLFNYHKSFKGIKIQEKNVNGGIEKKRIYSVDIHMCGDSGVGKTTLINRIISDEYREDYYATIGMEFQFKEFEKNYEYPVQLRIWDLAGEERFRPLNQIPMYSCAGFLLCYDITVRESFRNVEKWLNDLYKMQRIKERNTIVLVGCKSDLEDRRCVARKEAENFAKENGLKFFETSSKINVNIKEVTDTIIDVILSQVDLNLIPKNNPLNKHGNKQDSNLKCNII